MAALTCTHCGDRLVNSTVDAGFRTCLDCRDHKDELHNVAQFEPIEPSSSGHRHGVQLTRLSTIQMRRARFAWEPRIPLGALALVAGVPGQGKSTLAVELAARVTRGQPAGDLHGQPVDVVVASAEDAPSFVLGPRFAAAGADLDRVHVVTVHHEGADLGLSIPDDLEALRGAMLATGARLLVVDPLLAHIPVRIDGYKDQHVRVALAPLARLAEDVDAGVLAVMHLNKREAADLFSRIGGSGGFLAEARSAMLVGPDPSDDALRVLAHGKANLSMPAESVKFRLEPREIPSTDADDPAPIRVPGVAWLGETEIGVHELLSASKATARADATAWLAQVLAAGPMPEEWLRKSAEDAGHSWRTIRRAKDDLRIKSERLGFGRGGFWQWRLPGKGDEDDH